MFARNLYAKETETKHFEPLLAEIERIRTGLAAVPMDTSLNFIKESAMEQWLETDGDKKIVGTVIFHIFNRLQFFFISNILKTINLIDALELMYNAKNYLGWVLVGRSIIEHCAVFNYYTTKILDTKPCRNDFSISEVKALEDVLLRYSHGTRCNWTYLLAGDIANFNKSPNEPAPGDMAVSITTAIQKLEARKGAFEGIEGVYAIFSDFAHPNMGSHTTVVNIVPTDKQQEEIEQVELALNVNRLRGEFIIVVTLQPVCLCVQTIIELCMSLSPVFRHWNDELMQGRVHVRG